MSLTGFTTDDLARLEADVVHAVHTGNLDGLNMIDHGEVSIALGYPAAEPALVCKRMAIVTPAEAEHHAGVIQAYLAGLSDLGVATVPTACLHTPASGGVTVYVVQDLLDRDTIGHRVLQRAEPDAEHPLLVAIGDAITRMNDRISIDAQVTNWSFDGVTATLVDVGTPFLWNAAGELEMQLAPLARVLPAVVRPYLVKDLTRVIDRWKQPRAIAADVVANLYREGLDDWVAPTLVAMNTAVAPTTPITEADAQAIYEEDRKSFPLLKKAQAVERFWRTKVRRQPYDYLISDSTFR